MPQKTTSNYYCVCVRRNYEEQWRALSRHSSIEEAQTALDERRAYTGAFNYDNAELRIMSRSEAKSVFGASWEYHPIGEVKPKKPARRRKEEA